MVATHRKNTYFLLTLGCRLHARYIIFYIIFTHVTAVSKTNNVACRLCLGRKEKVALLPVWMWNHNYIFLKSLIACVLFVCGLDSKDALGSVEVGFVPVDKTQSGQIPFACVRNCCWASVHTTSLVYTRASAHTNKWLTLKQDSLLH